MPDARSISSADAVKWRHIAHMVPVLPTLAGGNGIVASHRDLFSAACSHVHGQAPWQGNGLQPAPKVVDDSDTPGRRQGVETTAEQALMRGLATA